MAYASHLLTAVDVAGQLQENNIQTVTYLVLGSGYGYGTVPGGRWTIDTEGGHVVDSVSLIRSGYEYGTVPDRRGTNLIRKAAVNVVNSVSRMRSL